MYYNGLPHTTRAIDNWSHTWCLPVDLLLGTVEKDEDPRTIQRPLYQHADGDTHIYETDQ